MRFSLILCLTACSVGTPTAVATQAAPLEELTDRFVEPQTRLRFPLREGVTVEDKHYDPTLPLKKFRHSIHLITSNGVAVVIDVWDNPTHRTLQDWFGEHLSFLIDGETRVSEREVTSLKLPALLLEQPRSEQAISMAVAVFAHREQVFRVTCIDSDAEGSALPRALFEALLHELELEVKP
ncbi:MAG: hypothetical protein Q8N23_11670 [Archangium sp.]|nr:hypothetical protein [Archangium sp.]MDP3153324.1 hypothetical protein [Archangium sp.]MDP3573390.1 hypothetical protein [Archangium sp.]